MAKKALTVYLAGPFFNEEQVATIKKLETLIESLGFEVYSPSRDGKKLNKDTDSPDLRAQVFDDNIKHLSTADIIVAVIDDRDTGTVWEMGCRYGRWLDRYHTLDRNATQKDDARRDCPMIVTYTDHDYGVNLMLTESIACHCKGVAELEVYLKRIDSEGVSKIERDLQSTQRVEVE